MRRGEVQRLSCVPDSMPVCELRIATYANLPPKSQRLLPLGFLVESDCRPTPCATRFRVFATFAWLSL